ncbi:MAG TPA: hypothetical protein VFW23_10030 [Tepidisphaeraceae bacterium]|nr:hypothetical protein [Tepidisphaeraceae bacterium]
MDDEIFNLESRLASLKPRPISPSLEPAISRAAQRPSRASVSFFWSATATGAIAASLIVAMLVAQLNGSAHPAPLAEVVVKVPAGSTPLGVLARADLRWGDDFGLNDNPIHP